MANHDHRLANSAVVSHRSARIAQLVEAMGFVGDMTDALVAVCREALQVEAIATTFPQTHREAREALLSQLGEAVASSELIRQEE